VGLDTSIAIGAAILAGITLLVRLFDKSLSIREHEEFRRWVVAKFLSETHQRERDMDVVLHRLDTIEATRPTTATLEARMERKPRNET
jgi:hypothetical protein